jgi:hypothetical protein
MRKILGEPGRFLEALAGPDVIPWEVVWLDGERS